MVIAQALKTAYCEEVLKRRRQFLDSADLDRRVTCVASALNRSDHRFGLVICGQVGNGKSTMVRAIANLLNRYRIPMPNDNDKYWQLVIRSSKDVAKSINADKDFTKLCNYPLLAIDDLGTEPDESKVYGTVYRPLEYLLEERYDRMLYTIITTNLLPSKIKDIYGPRVASRFNEMMILVEFDNPDYRVLAR